MSKNFNAKLSPKYVKASIREKVGKPLFKLENMKGKVIGAYHSKDLKV